MIIAFLAFCLVIVSPVLIATTLAIVESHKRSQEIHDLQVNMIQEAFRVQQALDWEIQMRKLPAQQRACTSTYEIVSTRS